MYSTSKWARFGKCEEKQICKCCYRNTTKRVTFSTTTYLSFATTLPQLKSVIFQEKHLEVLKCYNFLWMQRRHYCSPAASFCKLRYDTITLSQLKISDFSGENFKGFEVPYFFMSAVCKPRRWRAVSSPAASFANCVTTPYLLKVHLQTFLSIPITQKCQILWHSCRK